LISYTVAWDESIRFKTSEKGVLIPEVLDEFAREKAREIWLDPSADKTRYRGDLAQIYARVAPAVFVVRTRTGHGTGFLIDREGLVLTNHHVVADGFEYTKSGRPLVRLARGLPDENGVMQLVATDIPATIVHQDERRDLALLRIQGEKDWLREVDPIPLEGQARPAVDCVMIGHPASGMLWTIRDGRVSGVGRSPHDLIEAVIASMSSEGSAAARKSLEGCQPVDIVLSSCQANPGDSGGPLVDGEGRLLGVTYAIPADTAKDKFVYHVHLREVQAFLDGRPGPEQESRPMVPDPWRIGPNVAPGKTRKTSSLVDVLVGRPLDGGDSAAQFLIDLDERSPVEPGSEEELRSILERRSFDAELALHFAVDRRTAFYDRDNDGTFDLVLVDADSDLEADVRFRLQAGSWSVETEIDVPWLKVSYLTYLADDGEATDLALEKISALTR
jgi:hypothetical protein